MSTFRSGLSAQWAKIAETTYGVVPSLSTALFYACDNDTLKLKKVPKQGTGIFAGASTATAARRVVTEYSAGGGLPMDLPERGLNQMLFDMFGSYGQSAATLTEVGSTLVYNSTHTLGSLDGHTFAMQAARPDNAGNIMPVTYTGCKISEWEIAASMGEIAKLTLTIEGRNELSGSWVDPLNGSVPSLQSFTAPASGSVFTFTGATVYVGGTPSTTSGVTTITSPVTAGYVKGPISLKCTNAFDLDRFNPGAAPFRNEPLHNGLRVISGEMTVEWLSTTAYLAAYQADTATCIEYQFQDPTVIGTGSGHPTLSLLASNVRLEGDSPSVAGTEILTQQIPWSVLDDRTNNVLQAQYFTLDTA